MLRIEAAERESSFGSAGGRQCSPLRSSRAPRSFLAASAKGALLRGRSSAMIHLPTDASSAVRVLPDPSSDSSTAPAVSSAGESLRVLASPLELSVLCGTKYGSVTPYHFLTGQPTSPDGTQGISCSTSALDIARTGVRKDAFFERDAAAAVISRIPPEGVIGLGVSALLVTQASLLPPPVQNRGAASPGGTTAATAVWVGYSDGAVRVFRSMKSWPRGSKSPTIGDGPLQLIAECRKHSGKVTCLCKGSGDAAAYVFSTSHDWTVLRWRLDTGECDGVVGKHALAGRALLCLRARALLASGADDGLVRLWPTQALERPGELRGHTAAVVALLEAEGRLWSGSEDHTVIVWNLLASSAVGPSGGDGFGTPQHHLTGHRAPVVGLQRVDRLVYSIDKHATVAVWSIDSMSLLHSFVSGDCMPIGLHSHAASREKSRKQKSPTRADASQGLSATPNPENRSISPAASIALKQRSVSTVASQAQRKSSLKAGSDNGGPMYVTAARLTTCVKAVLCCFVTTEGARYSLLPDLPVAEALEAEAESRDGETKSSEVAALERQLEELAAREQRQQEALEQLQIDAAEATFFLVAATEAFLSFWFDMLGDHERRVSALFDAAVAKVKSSKGKATAMQMLEEKLNAVTSAKMDADTQLHEMSFQRSQLQAELASKKDESTKLRAQSAKQQQELKALIETHGELQSKHRELTHEFELFKQKTTHERQDSKRSMSLLEAQVRQLEQRVQAMDLETEKWSNRSGTLEQQLFDVGVMNGALEREKVELQRQLREQVARSALQRNNVSTQSECDAADRAEKPKKASPIRAPRAISDTRMLLEWLKEDEAQEPQSAERSSAMPLESSPPPDPGSEESGIVDLSLLTRRQLRHIIGAAMKDQQHVCETSGPPPPHDLPQVLTRDASTQHVNVKEEVTCAITAPKEVVEDPQTKAAADAAHMSQWLICMQALLVTEERLAALQTVELTEALERLLLERNFFSPCLLYLFSTSAELRQTVAATRADALKRPGPVILPAKNAHDALNQVSVESILLMSPEDECFQTVLKGVVASSNSPSEGDDSDFEEGRGWIGMRLGGRRLGSPSPIPNRSGPLDEVSTVMRAISLKTKRLQQLEQAAGTLRGASAASEGVVREMQRVHNSLCSAADNSRRAAAGESARPLLEVARGHLYAMRSPSR
jgi:hypothetical protein